jgi:hypothetical protein
MGNLSGRSFLVQLKPPESKPFSNNSQRGADTNIAMRRDGRLTFKRRRQSLLRLLKERPHFRSDNLRGVCRHVLVFSQLLSSLIFATVSDLSGSTFSLLRMSLSVFRGGFGHAHGLFVAISGSAQLNAKAANEVAGDGATCRAQFSNCGLPVNCFSVICSCVTVLWAVEASVRISWHRMLRFPMSVARSCLRRSQLPPRDYHCFVTQGANFGFRSSRRRPAPVR